MTRCPQSAVHSPPCSKPLRPPPSPRPTRFHLLLSFGIVGRLSGLHRRLLLRPAARPRHHRHHDRGARRTVTPTCPALRRGYRRLSFFGGLFSHKVGHAGGMAFLEKHVSPRILAAGLQLDGASRHPRRRTARDPAPAHAALALRPCCGRAQHAAQKFLSPSPSAASAPRRRRRTRRLLRPRVLRMWNAFMPQSGTASSSALEHHPDQRRLRLLQALEDLTRRQRRQAHATPPPTRCSRDRCSYASA